MAILLQITKRLHLWRLGEEGTIIHKRTEREKLFYGLTERAQFLFGISGVCPTSKLGRFPCIRNQAVEKFHVHFPTCLVISCSRRWFTVPDSNPWPMECHNAVKSRDICVPSCVGFKTKLLHPPLLFGHNLKLL